MKSILITGGCGFIGSNLIRHILDNYDFNIINVDSLTYAGNIDSTADFKNNSRYIFEKCDICDDNKLKNIFDKYKPSLIMHLAAESHVDNSISGSDIFIKTNIIGIITEVNFFI